MSDQDFRSDIRTWLESNAPLSVRGNVPEGFDGFWGGRDFEYPDDDHQRWFELACEKGLTAPTWPAEYGGGGYTRKQAKIIQEEIRRLRLPAPLVGLGTSMIGPTLLQCATEEQKREHIPRICRGEIRWCQGYSEPSAGSDLASLRTRAVRDGEDYVVNGQKIWTSYANVSDWVFALVRTDVDAPKHNGISFLLIDLSTPGVTVRPIQLISGVSPFCEVFFDDVRVPVANRIGNENEGWQVAKTLLGFERLAVADGLGGGNTFGSGTKSKSAGAKKGSSLGALAKQYIDTEDGVLKNTVKREEIAMVEMISQSRKLTTQYLAELAKAGEAPGPETSVLKVVSTELNQRREEVKMSLAGAQAIAWDGPGFSEDELGIPRTWLRSRANTIEGGTTEIQLNIIAKRILELE